MKKILTALIATAMLCGLAISHTGCGTTPATKIAQGAQIVIHTVNDGMAEWANYVNAGKATQKQIDTVKTSYNAYYAAGKALNAVADKLAANDPTATTADLAAANTAVQNAESALLSELASVMNAVIAHN